MADDVAPPGLDDDPPLALPEPGETSRVVGLLFVPVEPLPQVLAAEALVVEP